MREARGTVQQFSSGEMCKVVNGNLFVQMDWLRSLLAALITSEKKKFSKLMVLIKIDSVHVEWTMYHSPIQDIDRQQQQQQ